jgi:hypothetical protein
MTGVGNRYLIHTEKKEKERELRGRASNETAAKKRFSLSLLFPVRCMAPLNINVQYMLQTS